MTYLIVADYTHNYRGYPETKECMVRAFGDKESALIAYKRMLTNPTEEDKYWLSDGQNPRIKAVERDEIAWMFEGLD